VKGAADRWHDRLPRQRAAWDVVSRVDHGERGIGDWVDALVLRTH
jgi:hypothetical protein